MFYVITFLQEWQTHQMINRGLVSFGDFTCKILHFPQRTSDQQIRSGEHGGMTRLRKEKQRKERDEEKQQESQWNSSALWRNNPGPMPQTSKGKACKRNSGSILVQLAIEIGFVKVQLRTRIGFNCG